MSGKIVFLPLAAGIFFASVGIFVRELTYYEISNETILFLRAAFAVLIMIIFLYIKDKSLLKIKAKDVPLFIGTGIIGMLGLNLCYNNAINSLNLSVAAVLLSSAPVFVVVLAALLFKEKITGKKVLCICLVIVGCALAGGIAEMETAAVSDAAGILYGIGAALFYALYSIFSRLATDRGYHTYTVIFYSVLFITAVTAPFADFQKTAGFIGEAPIYSLVFLLLHALLTSVLPYIFITAALLYMEAGKVSIIASGTEPVAALVFGFAVYHETISILMALGIIITITALVILRKE